jgi:single-stranded DNA-specific DHH superfamily exonuclease
MWGWILFVLLLLWYFATMRFNAKRETNLQSYIIFLLLSDDILTDQRKKFQKWIAEANETRSDKLGMRAGDVVQYAAERLGTSGSALSSMAMVWKYKKQSQADTRDEM